MSTVDVENGAFLRAGGRLGLQRPLWRGPRFIVEVFDGADDALAALEAVQGGLVSTGFQTLNWLTVLYEELAPSRQVVPRVVVVTERNSGDVALILPLVIATKRSRKIARFANFGASGYGAPILGPAQLTKMRSIRRVWRAVRHAMRDVDMIELGHMPAQIGGRSNPLVTRNGITPSRKPGSHIAVPDTVESYLLTLDKKYRKEVERCRWLWQTEGAACFRRAETPEAIARVYSVLDEQQAARHAALGSTYEYDDTASRAFYERLAIDGSDAGLAALFALETDGKIIAALFGIEHDGVFTMLRLSMAGDAWRHVSPGRLAVIEAMKYFVARGVRRFDFGTGEHPLQHGFGAEAVPLYDLIVAVDVAAFPRAVFRRLKARWRKGTRARASRQRAAP